MFSATSIRAIPFGRTAGPTGAFRCHRTRRPRLRCAGEGLGTTQPPQHSFACAGPPALPLPRLPIRATQSQQHRLPNRTPIARPSALPPGCCTLCDNLTQIVERVATSRTSLLDLDPVLLVLIPTSPLDECSDNARSVLVKPLPRIGPPRDTDVVAHRIAGVEVDALKAARLSEAEDVDLPGRTRRWARPDPFALRVITHGDISASSSFGARSRHAR